MLNRRQFVIGSGLAALASTLSFSAGVKADHDSSDRDSSKILNRIAFGSCDKSWKSQDLWSDILMAEPDLFLFLGDTVYTDEKIEKLYGVVHALGRAYDDLSKVKEFKQFRSEVPVLATWDDHDYGVREGGANYADKETTRKLFLDFWNVSENDMRRTQTGGIYTAYQYGPTSKRVQIILLDTRYGRSPLIELSEERRKNVQKSGFGPYLPNYDPAARMLHDAQWSWLEEQLKRPAQLRIICTSIPFSAGFRGWESWSNFPLERTRFIKLIRKTRANGVIFLSGDTHYADLSCETQAVPYPLYDLTSSGLTHYWPIPGPNSNRVYDTANERNFGLLHLRWDLRQPLIVLEIRGEQGKIKLQHTLHLDYLRV